MAHGLVSTIGTGGLFYANAVGAFCVGSAGKNRGRLARAVHRWSFSLVDSAEFFAILFSYDAKVLAENEMPDGSFLSVISLLMTIGYPFSDRKLWGNNDLAWLGCPINVAST